MSSKKIESGEQLMVEILQIWHPSEKVEYRIDGDHIFIEPSDEAMDKLTAEKWIEIGLTALGSPVKQIRFNDGVWDIEVIEEHTFMNHCRDNVVTVHRDTGISEEGDEIVYSPNYFTHLPFRSAG